VKPLLLDQPLTDGTVTVRHWTRDDIPAIVAAASDPEIPRWTSVPSPYTAADAEGFLAALQPSMERGESCAFGVIADGAVAGAIGFPRLSWPDERAEVGYWLAAQARGRGIASRAVRLICAWGFEMGFFRIELMASTGNPASQRVAERTGFKREGVLRAHVMNKGRRLDMVVFSLLRGEL
jgi:RimJ/RimL family protein N-acetyltransferase